MTEIADEAENLDFTKDSDDQESRRARWRRRVTPGLSQVGWAAVAGVAVVAVLAGLTGWLGYRAYERHQANAQRDLFVQVARQGAVNLTSISYTEIDADVQRIIDLSTGAFREDFEQRSKPFIEVVKAAQSKSEGTVTDAGLESQRGDSAQILVAVAVKSQTAGGQEAPREWRMRIEVRSVGDDARVSNVVFVP
jgi:Mce-associated membrane protein